MENPTYEQVCSGRTGHTEAIELTYRPEQVRRINSLIVQSIIMALKVVTSARSCTIK